MKRLMIYSIILLAFTVSNVPAKTPVNRDYLKAQKLEQEGKANEARDIYERLYRSTGENQYFWRLMFVYERLDDFGNMEKIALSRLENFPDELATLRYLAKSYYRQGEPEKARLIVMRMIGDRWNDLPRVRLAASVLTGHNDHDHALRIYTTARNKNKNKSAFSVEFARIYLLQFEYVKAIDEYLKTLESVEISYVNIESVLNRAVSENFDPVKLARPLELYLEKNPSSIRAAHLLSRLKYKAGDYPGSYETLVHAAVVKKNEGNVWSLAERLRRDRHYAEALMVYENFCRLFPRAQKRSEALLKSAAIKVDLGDREGARADYLILANDYRGTMGAAEATLRMLELSEKDTNSDEYTVTLRKFASSAKFRNIAFEAYLALAKSYMSSGNTAEAQEALAAARLKARGKNEIFTVVSQSALYHFYTGDFRSMTRNIDACAGYSPGGDEINDLLGLKILGMRCSSEEDMEGLATLARGRYALFRGLVDEAVENLTAAAQDTSAVPASASAISLAGLYSEAGEFSKACTWFLHAASAANDTTERVEAMIGAADLLLAELKDSEKARSIYFEAVTNYPGTVYDTVLRKRLRALTEQ